MFITITSLRLKSIWKFFPLSLHALKIVNQTKAEKGLVDFRKKGIGRTHYTLTAWSEEGDLKKFARTGAHLEAMKASSKIASEIRIYTFKADRIPEWKEAESLLLSKGKLFKY
jgi:hypothetical protein